MFTGTVLHRVWAGQLSARVGWAVAVTTVAACSASFWLYTETWYSPAGQLGESPLTRTVTIVVVLAAFAVFLAARDRVAWPAVLRWLGRISYSVYLTHWVVMLVVPAVPASVPGFRVLTILSWIAVTLAVSEVTYRLVEKPAIDLGHKAAKKYRALKAARTARRPERAAGHDEHAPADRVGV
jgi:peptidoglycan/LPS O-acetylase OafA/YrhL